MSLKGDIGYGFIHVHHLRALAEIGEHHVVHPVEDLRQEHFHADTRITSPDNHRWIEV